MNPPVQPFSIHITPRDPGGYKSISTLAWDHIPGFAVLTGKNGSGKTQLLEILAYHYSGTVPQAVSHLPVSIETVGRQYEAHEIGYMPSATRFSGGQPSSIALMSNLRQQALQHVQNRASYRHDIHQTVRSKRLEKRFGGRTLPHNVNADQVPELFDENFEFAIDDVDITTGLTHVFFAHRVRILEAIERRTPGFDREGKPLGPAPWDVVNEALSVAGFPFEVISPQETSLTGNYPLKLRDKQRGIDIAAVDLSSGEKVLLQLVLWLFTATKDGLFPKLLLLDEPDAHLHPSMTVQFLDVISEVLVNRHGVRVILTTHSPSTVALAPPDSVFQLERGAPTVTPVESRADITAILTAGLVTVSPATKFCFVEDDDDVRFYETVYDILTDYGPSKDSRALAPSPSLAFIAASVGAGTGKISGGATIVSKWVEKLDAEPLSRTFLGIIDRDAGNTPSDRVFVIGRYSFENYMLDPLVLYALLLEEGTAPAVTGVSIRSGDEHLLRFLGAAELQAIADTICAVMAGTDPSLTSVSTVPVTYTNAKTTQVPGWVINHRGHDLLPIAQAAFGGARVVSPPRLLKALRRCRLVPEEIAKLLADMQAV